MARRDFEVLDGVARMLSVGAKDVPGRVEKLLEDKKTAAKELKRLVAESRDQPGRDVAKGTNR